MKNKSGEPSNYNKEKQGELFAEFQIQKAKGATYFKKGMLSGKKFTLSLSYENIVLISISFIMLFVIFFSLGVEKGKRSVLNDSKEHLAVSKNKSYEEETIVKNITIGEEKESSIIEHKTITPEETVTKELKPYTIQVVAFKKEESAEKEIERLKNNGFDAFLIPSDNWMQVCVGRYINREASKNDFETLKKTYPKCYFRKINN